MKLIFKYCWGDEGCCGTADIPFEYESKDKFVFDTLERFDKKFFEKGMSAELFDSVYLREEEINDIERCIMTLEEWFERDKTLIKQ